MREEIARQFTMVIILEALPVLVYWLAAAHHTMFIGLRMELNQSKLARRLSKGFERVVLRLDNAISMFFKKKGDSFVVKKIKLLAYSHFTLLVLMEKLLHAIKKMIEDHFQTKKRHPRFQKHGAYTLRYTVSEKPTEV